MKIFKFVSSLLAGNYYNDVTAAAKAIREPSLESAASPIVLYQQSSLLGCQRLWDGVEEVATEEVCFRGVSRQPGLVHQE
jgi:hypothetical protein